MENTLGVLVSSPNYPVHIDGVVEADEVMFYHPSLDVDNRHRFSLHYNTFESKHLDVDLHLQLSENDRHLFYANDQLAMSVAGNSVVFGDSSQTVSDLLIINNDSVDLLLESNTSDFDPHVGFIAKSATGSIGINEYGNLFIDPLYSDIVFQNFQFENLPCNQYGVVTIGVYSLAGYSAGCDYQLDVLGTLKSQYLFQRHVNTSGQEETLRMYSMPIGGITMWSGSQSDIPSGWMLCDGNNGSSVTDKYGRTQTIPDLRDMFIKGTSDLSGYGTTGGQNTTLTENTGDHIHDGGGHMHDITGGGHSHSTTIYDTEINDWSSEDSTTTSQQISVGEDKTVPSGWTGLQHSAIARTHSHQFQGTTHNHTSGNGGQNTSGGDHHTNFRTRNSAHTHTGGEHSHQWDNEPAYYVLAFIIFVGN